MPPSVLLRDASHSPPIISYLFLWTYMSTWRIKSTKVPWPNANSIPGLPDPGWALVKTCRESGPGFHRPRHPAGSPSLQSPASGIFLYIRKRDPARRSCRLNSHSPRRPQGPEPWTHASVPEENSPAFCSLLRAQPRRSDGPKAPRPAALFPEAHPPLPSVRIPQCQLADFLEVTDTIH